MASLRIRTRKDGTQYTSVLFDHEGKQSSVSFDDHEAAVKFRNLMKQVGPGRALMILDTQQTTVTTMTVAEWVNHHIEHLTGVEKGSVKRYQAYLRNDIVPQFGATPLPVLSRDDIADWVNDMDDGDGNYVDNEQSPKTIHNKVRFFSGTMNAAVAAGHIPANPAKGVKLPKIAAGDRKVYLEHDEFLRLLAEIPPYWKPMVEFMVASGARWSEVTALTPRDVDRRRGTVRINKAWKSNESAARYLGGPKSHRGGRTIHVDPSILAKIDYSHELLFVNRDGTSVKNGFARRVWYPALQRSGIGKDLSPGQLRHTCASWLLAGGASFDDLQAHLGHESIETTLKHYAARDPRRGKGNATIIANALSPTVVPLRGRTG